MSKLIIVIDSTIREVKTVFHVTHFDVDVASVDLAFGGY